MNIGVIAVDEAVRDYEEAVIRMIAEEFEKDKICITNYPYHFFYAGPESVVRLVDEAIAKSDRLILITDVIARGSEAFSKAIDEIGKRRIWPIILVTHIEDEAAMKDNPPLVCDYCYKKVDAGRVPPLSSVIQDLLTELSNSADLRYFS